MFCTSYRVPSTKYLPQIYFLIWMMFLSTGLPAQVTTTTNRPYPQNYFRRPLDLKPSIIGTFGDLRKNHFHSGLDYRTNQREGYPVYAVADGFISRIKVQIGGFGNALYIDHPNGYTSVYAHLQRFNEPIAHEIKNCQYQIQSFEIDFPLLSNQIPIKKGEIIGWSGNTGSSSGPHLHFEIRDTKTEEIINPQQFGLALPDHTKPEIDGLYSYQIDNSPFNDRTPKHFFATKGTNGAYQLAQSSPIIISKETGFGIIAYDRLSPLDSKHNVYSIHLLIDGKPIYASQWERFSFDHSKAINSYIDYPTWITSGRWIQKSFVEPGNPLCVYKNLINNGLFSATDDQVHLVQYLVKDIQGNTSTLNFKVKYDSKATRTNQTQTNDPHYFNYNQANNFSTADIKIFLPKGALYSDLNFNYAVSPKPAYAFSNIYHIHNKLTPLNDTIGLWIKLDNTCPMHLRTKTLIVNDQKVAQPSFYGDGYVKATLKTFGNFYITIDTIAPKIVPINISEGKSMTDIPRMVFKITDNLSGIKEFMGTIDGKWILMEFDPKSSTLWHTFDDRTTAGKHIFQLIVKDKKTNASTYHTIFFR